LTDDIPFQPASFQPNCPTAASCFMHLIPVNLKSFPDDAIAHCRSHHVTEWLAAHNSHKNDCEKECQGWHFRSPSFFRRTKGAGQVLGRPSTSTHGERIISSFHRTKRCIPVETRSPDHAGRNIGITRWSRVRVGASQLCVIKQQ
jgi:hypothetical protein